MLTFPTIQLVPTDDLTHGNVVAYGDNKRGLIWHFAHVAQGGIPVRGASIVDLSDFLSCTMNARPSQHFYLVFGGQLEYGRCLEAVLDIAIRLRQGI